MNSPWTARAGTTRARTGPVRPHTTPERDFCKFWLCHFPYKSVRVTYGTLVGPGRAPCNPIEYEKQRRFPYGARAMPARASHGVHVASCKLFDQTIMCTTVSSRTGRVARCYHENSTSVKILRALHSALWARTRTGAKNRTGPVVGCD